MAEDRRSVSRLAVRVWLAYCFTLLLSLALLYVFDAGEGFGRVSLLMLAAAVVSAVVTTSRHLAIEVMVLLAGGLWFAAMLTLFAALAAFGNFS